MRAMVLVVLVAGCGSEPMTDQQYCEKACATLERCGVPLFPTCVNDCKALPSYLSCVKSADLSDCNSTAACSFKFLCNGAGPSGSSTCKQAADCEGACVLNGTDCTCACAVAMSPSKANNLLINNACAAVKCGNVCGPGKVNGTACLGCFSQMCANESAQCQSN